MCLKQVIESAVMSDEDRPEVKAFDEAAKRSTLRRSPFTP